ncbi:hypothetical protein [Pontibacter mangrovi]|uniref:Phage capsid protein n=1 Tax=Pontibacter mangrovi TaxID=2589816 RepID=A0A501WAY3_9BACT|nr:hypothetical protein [Pontibacter mangrovi]TPE43967.1 hypothetical protein FJM65_11115 [Pontibacter mangrovi]
MVDLSALPAELKDHAVQYREQILQLILISELGFLNYMQLIDEVTDEIVLTQMFTNSVLQPGNKDEFNPKGAVGFKTRTGKVRPCKVDLTMKHTDLTRMYKSYLGKVKAAAARKDVYDLLFQDEIFDAVIKRVKQDLHLEAVFKGKYNADGTTPKDTMEGLLFIIQKDIAAANIATANAVTVANAIEEVEKVADLVPSAYAQKDLVMLVDPVIAKYYNRDYRTTYGSLNYNNEYKKVTIDGTNTEIIPEPGIAGTGGIIVTPRNNFVWLTNSLGGMESINVEKSKRNIDMLMDFEAAPEVAIMEEVWMNDNVSEWVTANTPAA